MWNELSELLVAFGGALFALWVLFTAISVWSGKGQKSELRDKTPDVDREQHLPIGTSPQQDDHGGVQQQTPNRSPLIEPGPSGPPTVFKIFTASDASASMREVDKAQAEANRGLKGDRYAEGCGFWSEKDECEVTLIAREDLEMVAAETGIKLASGEHRRNVVTQNIQMRDLVGKRFQIGEALFAFDRPRPPCLHLQTITEPGMAHALVRASGICVRCTHGGTIRQGDRIVLLDVSPAKLIRNLLSTIWKARSSH